MKYRAQPMGQGTRSPLNCTLPRVEQDAPALPRTFRTFRKIQDAVTYMAKMNEERAPKLSKRAYGADPRDTRYVVNFYGSHAKPRIKLASRVIMSQGISFDRLLPVCVTIVS